jgi:hypothetical protein
MDHRAAIQECLTGRVDEIAVGSDGIDLDLVARPGVEGDVSGNIEGANGIAGRDRATRVD